MRPRPTLFRRIPTLLVASALVASVAACSSSSSTTASSSASMTAGASSASAASSAPVSTSPAATFTLLPDSVLSSLTPLVYRADPKADVAMAASGARATVNAVFSGGISRTLDYQGKTVGGVELYRFNDTVPAAGREKFVPLMVDSFAQKASTPSTLAGTKVQVADQARNTNITVVGWTHGQDVVIVWASGVPATQQIAQQYISQTP